MSKTPNPGSDEAIAQGCLCPVMDNGRGKGYMGGMKDETGQTLFVKVVGCPLHAPTPGTAEFSEAVKAPEKPASRGCA